MKKVFFVIALAAVMVLAGCVSYAMWYRQDGLVPYGHFQKAKQTGERLVFISPVLAPNHRQSMLYIITNPEDIIKAMDTLGDPDIIRPGDIDNALKAFSPVIIKSSRDLSTVNPVSDYDISNQDGIAGFSLPSFIEQFFYAYVYVRNDYKWGSNDPVNVWSGLMSLPPGSQDVFITISEEKGEMVVSANVNPAAVIIAYENTTGLYGLLREKKDQLGFIKIGLKERVAISDEKQKAKALAAGATLRVYSGYFTNKQETRNSVRYVEEQSHWEPGQTVGFYNISGVKIGEARTAGRQVTDVPAHTVNENYTVNVRVPRQVEFELYKGNVLVLRGKTPTEITGIEVGMDYTLRWVSPDGRNRSTPINMGLNFLGYPDSSSYYLK
jgi:hypothetical protein